LEGESLEEVFYEGYGPVGSALVIKVLTPNTNRTATNVKTFLNKFGGSLGQQGSVAWQFDEKGVIVVDGKMKKEFVKGKDIETLLPLNQEELEMEVLELPVDDISVEEGTAVIFTKKVDFSEVLKGVE